MIRDARDSDMVMIAQRLTYEEAHLLTKDTGRGYQLNGHTVKCRPGNKFVKIMRLAVHIK